MTESCGGLNGLIIIGIALASLIGYWIGRRIADWIWG